MGQGLAYHTQTSEWEVQNGKVPKLPDNEIRKVRESNRRLIEEAEGLSHAAVLAKKKSSKKPKNEDEKRKTNKEIYRTIIQRNPLLKKAVKENIAKKRLAVKQLGKLGASLWSSSQRLY